jgi:hypothetical protein
MHRIPTLRKRHHELHRELAYGVSSERAELIKSVIMAICQEISSIQNGIPYNPPKPEFVVKPTEPLQLQKVSRCVIY